MFNLSSVAEYSAGGVLPAGDYTANILDAELTKSKSGSPMIKVTFDLSGIKIYDYLILDPSNQRGFNIGLSKAKSILLAVGSSQMNFMNELDLADAMVGDLILSLDIKHEDYMGDKKEKNIIKKFSALPKATRPQRPTRGVKFDTNEIPF